MQDRWYILRSNTADRKSGPHTLLELLDMQKARKIKDDTAICNENGIGGAADNLIGFADEMLGGVFLTPRQQAFLRVLGYTGPLYMSQEECSRRIESLKIKGSRADDLDFEDEVDKAAENHEKYVRDALIAFGKGERFKARPTGGRLFEFFRTAFLTIPNLSSKVFQSFRTQSVRRLFFISGST